MPKQRDSSPKNLRSVIIYSNSCCYLIIYFEKGFFPCIENQSGPMLLNIFNVKYALLCSAEESHITR